MGGPARQPAGWARPRRRYVVVAACVVLVIGTVLAVAVATRRHAAPPRVALPLRLAGELALPGDSSRFDYAALDAARGLLFIAHLGASDVVEVDVHAARVVRVIPGVSQVHGVFVVPDRHRVYATATGVNQLVILDEDTGGQLAHASTGAYPDGLAYDPVRHAIWTTNETGGSETVVDAVTGQPQGTVALGGEAGNVAYDSVRRRMLVDVQTRNELAVIDPATLAITRRVPLPGCDHDHGLALDPAHRLAFVGCDANATLFTVDLDTWQVLDANRVGDDPDVLAFDAPAGRLYVAAESGWLTVLDERDGRLAVAGRAHLADGAHVVAVDPGTHRSYYPVPHGRDGHPALLSYAPTTSR
jgi:DNA-binding beta-propeller fold protein YncE